jgi:hypothetical protein
MKIETYECKLCNIKYKSKKISKKCEDFCKKHKACNSQLIKHSIK